MVVGESDFRHHVEDDIRPFRDVLLGLFFVTVGMEVNPTIVMVAPMAVFAWLIVLLPGKAAIALLVGTIMRWPMSVGARVAVILAHGGEFGLLLLTEGVHAGAIGVEVAHPALLSLAITMALGPMLIQRNARLAALISSAARRRRAAAEQEIIEAGHGLDRHIVLCGCGRVGHLVALVLETANLPYIATDLGRFRRAKKLGHKVIFDASRKRVLDAPGYPGPESS